MINYICCLMCIICYFVIQMKRLVFLGLFINEAVDEIASCVDNINELKFNAEKLTKSSWNKISTAINKRPTPVSRQ